MNGYEAFAAFYDALTDDVDYAAWADYLLAAVTRHGGRADTVLDLACGSGSLSLELSRRGCDVVAVDASADMLALAREKAASARRDVLFLCQDMRRLDLYGTVDTAVCLLDSLSHLCHTDDVRAVLARLGLFIAPDGLLVFDVNTPYKHAHILGDNAFVYEREEFLCTWRNRYYPATHEVEMALDFFVSRPDGAYERYADTVRERAYALATWGRLLAEAGFALEGVYDERRFCAPPPDAARWVLVARNRAIHQKK